MDKDLCILPFVGLYIRADGNIYPCESVAWSGEKYCLGSLETHTLEEAWNAEPIRKLRQKVFKTGTCELSNKQKNSCMYLIDHTLYQDTYNTFKDKIKEDGSYPFELRALFLERSNLCNLKCIYCCATSSTVWEKETGVVAKKIDDEHYDNKLSPHLVHLKELFLSGGEPVLHPFNFKILRFLKSINPNLRLGMATNLTYSFDKHREFFDLYCSFPNSKIFCSIDIDGERFEAIRVNSKWDLIEKNLFELKKYNTKIYFNSVISVLNIPYFKNFHKEMIQKGIIDIDSIRYLTLSGPEALNIQNLPEEKKRNYLILLISYIAFLKTEEAKKTNIDLYPNNKLPSAAITNIYKYLCEPSLTSNSFDYKTQLIKHISQDTLTRLFPEAI